MRILLALGLGLLVLPTAARAQIVDYYHTDAIGNVRAITDQLGNVVERHDYLPFGEECTTGSCADNPGVGAGQAKKFTGKERDAETGFDYFGARYYGSKIARFASVDPVYNWQQNTLDAQRWNRYAYGRNNPFRYVDPDGRDVFTQQEVFQAWDQYQSGQLTFSQYQAQMNGVGVSGAAGVVAFGALIAPALAAETSIAVGRCGASPACNNTVHEIAEGLSGVPSGPRAPANIGGLSALGRAGRGKNVREVVGTAEEAEAVFKQLSKGGRSVEKAGYPGRAVEFEDGSFVGYRPASKSGPPTIDAKVTGAEANVKVKFVKE